VLTRWKWCRVFVWRLDVLTHCRIRWVCDAAEDAVWVDVGQ